MKLIPCTTIKNYEGDIKMAYYVPKNCRLFKRKTDSRWEARMKINGEQKFIACYKKKGDAYHKLKEALRDIKRQRINRAKDINLFAWLDHWHTIYRMPKKRIIRKHN